ncbi:MAG TPA: alkaline phosphatase D family protein [Gaiellaceae bacterium]|nr:alkaline phosphatase D family protein [Gaiellaceae bacterium]
MGIGAVLALAAAAGNPFTLGVAAGEVTPSGAQLWAHATPGAVVLEVARDRRLQRGLRRRPARADKRRDGTIHVRVGRLKAGTVYYYRFRRGRATSTIGRFVTAPPPGRAAVVRFAVSGDADATPGPGSSSPFYNRFQVYARMAAERNAFNVNLGDTIYSDSDVAGTTAALTLAAKHAKYRLNLALPALRRIRSATGLYSHWDDHEFVNDFSREENGAAVYAAGVRAFTDYAPVTYTSANGLYRTFRWGKNLELFLLDERSFRSAKASAGGTCNDARGSPDLAPTAPAAVRAAFSTLIPPLKQPAPAACLARIADPARTMLGEHQYDRFTTAVARSTATFKVILNEVPIQQFYALPYDRWEGYAAERQKLIRFLHDNVKNVVFLTTDTHANFVNDVRFQTLESGGPADSGITEVVTGPVATRTFAREIDNTLGTTGAGILISGLFFKPPAPRGVGMSCVSPDVYSYAEVSVTETTLTVTPKDSQGRIVTDITGQPCTPVVIQSR